MRHVIRRSCSEFVIGRWRGYARRQDERHRRRGLSLEIQREAEEAGRELGGRQTRRVSAERGGVGGRNRAEERGPRGAHQIDDTATDRRAYIDVLLLVGPDVHRAVDDTGEAALVDGHPGDQGVEAGVDRRTAGQKGHRLSRAAVVLERPHARARAHVVLVEPFHQAAGTSGPNEVVGT